jgi:hypothetical protein
MEKHENFLKLNGEVIQIVKVDGTVWISLPSLCKALNIHANRHYRNAKNDPIIGPGLSIQTVQVSKNGQKQGRSVTCIPERLVYGWLFTIKSDSPELLEYKKTCYDLLFNHFHGTIGGRRELLLEKVELKTELHKIEAELREQNESAKRADELKKKLKSINGKLSSLDNQVVNQKTLFEES